MKDWMSQREPLMGSTLTILWKLTFQNKLRIAPKYWYRFGMTNLITSLYAPLRIAERIRFGRKIKKVKITAAPVFIIGHWRTGTTLLHYLLSLDDGWAFAINKEVYLPFLMFTAQKLVDKMLDFALPERRPMDDVKLGKDLPGEEEFALAIRGVKSFYYSFMFPRNIHHYSKYLTMKTCSKKEREKWKRRYYNFLQKLTLKKNGKRLLLKSPTNTGRIDLLQELFPKAKFIFLKRNPYETYVSTKHLFQKLLPYFSFQKWQEEKVNDQLLSNLKELWQSYQKAKIGMAENALVEVPYEQLIQKPLEEVKRIYKQLQLRLWGRNTGEKIDLFLREQATFKPNKHFIDQKLIEKVNSVLGKELIEQMGYVVRST
ncbi:MAG: sulfotransferase family protein [Candidatus Heimdallarchaeota archaeon]